MVVGTIRLEIFIPGSNSLKGKRKVVKALVRRLRNRFNISVAEVAANNLWQRATLGVAVVSGNSTDANKTIYKVLNTVENDGNVEVLDHQISIR
jgi:uncharacterized protein YlxP (DUF503 family)